MSSTEDARWGGQGGLLPWSYLPIAITAFLVVLRLGDEPLGGDEPFSIQAARRPLSDLADLIWSHEANMGPFYLALHLWLKVSSSTVWIRLLPAIGGVVAVALVAAIGTRWWGRRTGLIAGLLYALHPYALVYLTNVRAYSWAVAAGLVATLAVRPEEQRIQPWCYGIATGLGTAMNLVNLLLVPAHAIALLVSRAPRAMWNDLARGAVLGGLVVLPFTHAYAVRQDSQVDWIHELSPIRVAAAMKDLSGGHVLAMAGGIVLAWIYLRAARGIDLRTALVLAPLPTAVVGLAAISLIQPLFVPRYLIFVLPFMALTVGWWLAHLERFRVLGTVAAVVLVSAVSWPLTTDPERITVTPSSSDRAPKLVPADAPVGGARSDNQLLPWEDQAGPSAMSASASSRLG